MRTDENQHIYPSNEELVDRSVEVPQVVARARSAREAETVK